MIDIATLPLDKIARRKFTYGKNGKSQRESN